VFFGLLIPVIAQRYVKLSPDLPPLIYSASTRVQQGLVESGYEEQGVFYSCEIDAEQLQGPGVYDIYYRPFYLYFRLAGWERRPIPCGPGDEEWKAIAAAGRVPLVRLYHRYSLGEEYLAELTETCRHYEEFKTDRVPFEAQKDQGLGNAPPGIHYDICF
jgi:hypothetical protein